MEADVGRGQFLIWRRVSEAVFNMDAVIWGAIFNIH
jgi:hypothetical protein